MVAKIQLGKNGLTEGFMEKLKELFKNNTTVRISMLKSSDRDLKKEIGNQIIEELGKHYTVKIIGFTLIVKKWRQAKRE